MILAIDNGLSGSLAVLSSLPGLPPVALVSLPVQRVHLYHRAASKAKASGTAKKKKVKPEMVNELDAVALKAIITGFGPLDKIEAIIFEDCPDHGDRTSTVKSMAGTAGKIMAVLELLGLAGITYRVQSHTWQPVMLGKVPQGKTKEVAEAVARGLWPSQDWRRTAKCKGADSGHIDAALIAQWGLLNVLRRLPRISSHLLPQQGGSK